jgi:site-specific DNA recombinase
MKVIIYTRVSTDDQKEFGFSLQDQEARLRKYCDHQGYEIVEHFQDDHSAKDFNRPAFQKMLTALTSKKLKADLFLCVRTDRFTRNMIEGFKMIQELKRLGIDFRVLEGDVKLDQPESLLPFALNMLLPQIENERRGLNTKRGMRQAMKEGRWVNSPPKGYSMIKQNGISQLVRNDEAVFIIDAFNEVAKGVSSVEEIRKNLFKIGLKCSKAQFYNILKNLTYTGQIKIAAWRDEPEQIVEGIHEALINRELFENVQDVLFGRKKNIRRTLGQNEKLPLRGHLICPRCGNMLTGSGSLNRIKIRYYYYHCQHGCKERVNADKTNLEFMKYLESFDIPKEIIKLYYKIVQDVFRSKNEANEKALSQMNAEKDKLKHMIDSANDRFIEGTIDEGTYQSAE